MNITPDQFQTGAVAWIGAITFVSVTLAGAVAKVYSVIESLKKQIKNQGEQLQKLLPPVVDENHPILQEPQKQHNHLSINLLLIPALAIALDGCSLGQKSNNASLSGTGLYYDSTAGKFGAGVLHASVLTHRDGQPAQVTIQTNYSWLPWDGTMSSKTETMVFGNPVASFNSVCSGSNSTTSFSEQK